MKDAKPWTAGDRAELWALKAQPRMTQHGSGVLGSATIELKHAYMSSWADDVATRQA